MIQEKQAPTVDKESAEKSAEAKQDVIYLAIAVFGTLFLVSTLMVGIYRSIPLCRPLTYF
jgi:hypothetical protein